jgi:hypothetical protein
MSIKAISWVFNQDIRPSALKFVLLALADNVGDDTGTVWPSLSVISQKTSQDRKTVISAIDELERLGFLLDTGKRTGATRQVKIYQMVGLPSSQFHYTYKLTNIITGEFYIGVRSCWCPPADDKYFGSGKWPQSQKKKDLTKEILQTHRTRQEAESDETQQIRANAQNALCKNVQGREGEQTRAWNRPAPGTVPPTEPSHKSVETVPFFRGNSSVNGTRNRKEPLLNQGKEAAGPPAPPPLPVESSAEPPEAAFFKHPDLAAARRDWLEFLDEQHSVRLQRMALRTLDAELLRGGLKNSVETIRFSISRRAKHLIWNFDPKELPKHLRYLATGDTGGNGGTDAAVSNPPGLKEWIARKYPTADCDRAWRDLNPDIRKEFAADMPHLRFRGALLQIYAGLHGEERPAA